MFVRPEMLGVNGLKSVSRGNCMSGSSDGIVERMHSDKTGLVVGDNDAGSLAWTMAMCANSNCLKRHKKADAREFACSTCKKLVAASALSLQHLSISHLLLLNCPS